MRVIILSTYPFDSAPGQRFRYEQYLPFLKENGIETKHYPFLSQKGWKLLYKQGKSFAKAIAFIGSFLRRFGVLFSLFRCDYVFIFREVTPIGPPVFEWIISKVLRKKIIYDFDDAIWLPNYSEANARFQRLKMYGKVRKIMKWADKVTAGNEFLADFARQYNSNVTVIPTTVDMINVHNQDGNKDQEIPVIGWTGSHTTSQYLSDLLPALDQVYKQVKFRFIVISNLPPDIDREYLEFVKWNNESEIQDLAQFNIGIMPLKDSEWTKGKCGFKAIQYMSLGIPTLLSPVGVNIEIVKDGETGFFCSNEGDWIDKLLLLLRDKELRATIGLEGKKTILQRYSVAANQSKYLELFK